MRKYYKYHPSGLFVSRDGEVYMPRSGKHNEHFTYGNTDNNGYKRVRYKGKRYAVHRLIADCYIPNPDNLPTVDHINRVKNDNRVENLRWADYSLQNTNHSYQKNNASSKRVLQLTKDGQLVKEWPSANECHRNGFDKGNVCKCCRGEKKQYKGYIWKHKKELEDYISSNS